MLSLPRTNRTSRRLPLGMAVLLLLAAPGAASAQARASIGVAAQIAHSSSVRSIDLPRQIGGTPSGSAYAARLSLAGPARVNVSVALEAGSSAVDAPAVRVRDAAGRLQPLVAGGEPVVVVDRAPTDGSLPVDVEYRVARGTTGESREPLTLTYTISYPGAY